MSQFFFGSLSLSVCRSLHLISFPWFLVLVFFFLSDFYTFLLRFFSHSFFSLSFVLFLFACAVSAGG